MKKILHLSYFKILLIIGCFSSLISYSQDATTYSFSSVTAATLQNMSSSTQLIASGQDDVSSALTNIGFSFNYSGTNYTQFSVSSNGLLRLGATTVTTQFSNNISHSAPLIAPFWDDLHTNTDGQVHYKMNGTAPNRVITIEWQVGTYPTRTTPYKKTFQVTLEETTNIIRFSYGADTGTILTSATVGINSSTSLYQTVNTSTNTSTTAALNNNTVFPTSGTQYIWEPFTCSTYLLTSTTSTTPICSNNQLTINLNSTIPASLPIGNYIVTYNLSAPNAATGNTATMTVSTAGTGSFATTTLSNAGLTTATVTMLTKGSCSSNITSSNTTSTTVIASPTVNVGATMTTLCKGGTTSALGGTYGGAATSAVWSSSAGGTFTNNTGLTPSTTTWTPPATYTGTAVLTLTSSGGTCGTATDTKNQIVSTPTVSAGSTLSTICQGSSSVALGGSFSGSATAATWSDGSIGGTFSNNSGSSPNTATWTPPSGYTGTATLTLTSSGGTCGTVSASKNQVVNLAPTASAGVGLADICKGATTVPLGGSYGGSAASAIWSTTSGGTFSNNTGSTPNTTTWTPPSTFVGSATLTLTTSGGSCTAAIATKTQNVIGPTITIGTALSAICSGQTSTALGATFGGTATSAIWSDGGIGGIFVNNSGSTPNTTTWTPPAVYTGTATLTLTTSGGSCGTTTASKNQVVSPGSFASVGSAMTVTGSLTSLPLGGSPSSGTWTTVSGPSGTVTFSNSTSGSSTATVSSIGTYVFRWTVSSTCGTSFAEINVTYVEATASRTYTLFYEDFDASNGGWTNSTSTNGSWIHTNSFPSTIAEIGENSFWRLNNFDDYNNNSTIEIDSPVYNFSGYENLLFNVDVRYKTENNNDGMRILYSINGGAFVQLGSNTTGNNWYNTTAVAALGSNGWSNDNATSTLAFTPVGIGANRFTRATTILDDATFRNQSNVRFRVQFKSNASITDNGVAFDNVSVEGDAIVPLALSPIAPAKINQNLSLWFKSNAGISATDGSTLTAWEDQAYDVTRADLVNKESVKALATDGPTYRDNANRNINFNPVVDFNANNKNYMNGKGGLYSHDYFVVLYSDDEVQNSTGSNGRQTPIGGKSDDNNFHEDPTGLGLGNTTARYSTDEVIAHNVGAYTPGTGTPTPSTNSYGRAFSSTTITYNEPLIINVKTNASGTETEIYKNGVKIDNLTARTGNSGTGNLLNFYQYKNIPFYIGTGRSGLSGRTYSALNGRLSEVVAYTAPNSAFNQQKIQSYLGLKYGITLHNSTSTNTSGVSNSTRLNDVNYIDSAGNIIWNTTINSAYDYDIAGIGRDDDSQLYQKQSKTVNSTDDITIGLTTIASTNNLNTSTCNDRNFLIWGNNNGTLAAQPAVVVNMSANISPALTTQVTFTSIGRTWKVVETGGDVPICKISIPTTMLTATITPPGDFLMFISDTPVFDPTAEYRIMTVNGTNLETTYDFNGTKYITFGYAPEKTFVRSIKFNGTTDYLDAGKVLNLNTSFTVSAWVNPSAVNKTIFSKRDSAFTTGYELSINAAGKAQLSWMNSGTKRTITSNAVLPLGKWHHLGVIYNGTIAKFYVDGITVNSATLPTVPTNTQSFLIGAADGTTPTSFFSGWIDEVRVWNTALTEAQYRYVMNQEILKNSTLTNGSILPNTITKNDISAVPWSNLDAYYPMSTYTYTNAKDMSSNSYTAALRNIKTVDLQTAPLPHESQASGLWTAAATWLNNAVQDNPYSVSIEDTSKTIDWNIVKTSHAISSTGNKTLLGLIVNSNTLSADNNTKIELSHYLKLDGKIDLVDKSQLVQTEGSDLDVTSTGSIEKDQLGQGNKYNYNYWGSPVGKINSTQNNAAHSVADVMRDGTTTTPQTINWIGGYDGTTGTPISIAKYWLYKFDTSSNSYANWTQINETGSLRVGQGFTMKGNKGASTTQNYTFVGKPNNGTISSNSVGASQLLLAGNPYASSLDATAFINDNLSTIDGNIYFWEHYTTNSTHNLKDYQGGYAVRNLTGGAPASAALTSAISGSGTATKGTPNQFIPVGQGFFVYGKTGGGGTLVFKNSQRSFHKEDETGVSNATFRVSATAKTKNAEDNSNDVVVDADQYKKIRLGYTSAVNFHRQVLLGFMNEKATNNFDNGYDAYLFDSFPNDMTLYNNGIKLVIQGEGYFDSNATYPLAVKADQTGIVSFSVDGLENFDEKENFYILDKDSNTYTSIKENPFQISIDSGEYLNRFELTFKNGTETSTEQLSVNSPENKSNEIAIIHIQNSSSVSIENKTSDTIAKKVILYDMAGKVILTWETEKLNQESIQLPLTKIGAGVYIIAVQTNKGKISKQIIMR